MPHRQATVAALSANAPSTASELSVAPAVGVSIPPACNRFAAKPARAVCAATGPRVARKTTGRGPLSARSRSASNSCAYRRRGRPPVGSSGSGGRVTAGSARFGYSLTPVIASARVARFAARFVQVSASRPASSPEARAAAMPPDRSRSVKTVQARWASASVRDSTYQDPPAGSITPASLDSAISIDWVLRAIRRANALDRPMAASNGVTVTASAPPIPAAKQATVVRNRFTHGSRRVIMAGAVTACCRCARAAGRTPLTSVTRAHSRRAARSLAMPRNWSAPTA